MSDDFRWQDEDDDGSQAGDEPSPGEIIRRQRDRPVEELGSRLQALRARARSPAHPEPVPQTLYDVDDALVSPEITHKPGGVISAGALSKAQQKQIELLQDIVGGSLADDADAAGRLSFLTWPRLVVALVIFSVVALPFVLTNFRLGDLPAASFDSKRAAANDVFTALDSLDKGDRVLVGFEYGPAAAGELDALADVLLRHIFFRGAKPIIVSSNPVAVAHAQNVLRGIHRSVGSAGMSLQANQDYYVLRYLAGGALGLRDLSHNFGSIAGIASNGLPTFLNLRSLDEMALMLLMAERADDVRQWAEQVAPTTDADLVAAIGYAAQPLAEPYLRQADGIRGWLVGIRDAYTYGMMLESRLLSSLDAELEASNLLPPATRPQGTPTPEPNVRPVPTATAVPDPTAYVRQRDRQQDAARLNAMTLGTVAAVVIVFLGNVYFGLRALAGRRPGSKS